MRPTLPPPNAFQANRQPSAFQAAQPVAGRRAANGHDSVAFGGLFSKAAKLSNIPTSPAAGKAMLWEMGLLALTNLLMPIMVPAMIGLSFAGMGIAKVLGLKVDPNTNQFTRDGAKNVRNVYRRLAKIQRWGIRLALTPARWVLKKETYQSLFRKVSIPFDVIRRMPFREEAIQQFFKIPPTFFGKIKHIAKMLFSVVVLMFRKRLRLVALASEFFFIRSFRGQAASTIGQIANQAGQKGVRSIRTFYLPTGGPGGPAISPFKRAIDAVGRKLRPRAI